MATIPESSNFHAGIFQLETTTPAKGGVPVFDGGNPTDGHLNAPLKQLADRTLALRDAMPNSININRSNFDVTVTNAQPYNLNTFRAAGTYTLLLTDAAGLQNGPAAGLVDGDRVFLKYYVSTAENSTTQVLEVTTGTNQGAIWTRAYNGSTWSSWTQTASSVQLLTQATADRRNRLITVSTGSPFDLDTLNSAGFYSITVNNETALTNRPDGLPLADGDVVFVQVTRDEFFFLQRLWHVKSTSNSITEPGFNEWYRAYVTSGVDTGWSGWQCQANQEYANQFATPPGTVQAFAFNTAPVGWLKANGAAVSRTTYAALFANIGTTFGVGDGSTTFNLPDLRGEFVRGWDDGRGVDSGRAFGSAQGQAIQSHTHEILRWAQNAFDATGGQYLVGQDVNGFQDFNTNTLATGGTETRPRNVALLYCIKF